MIRWAFEAQGLYRNITNAPGHPPPVDVYIPDRRPLRDHPYGDITYGPGSYNPVSLEWDPRESGPGAPPIWQADQAASSWRAAKFLWRWETAARQAHERRSQRLVAGMAGGPTPAKWNTATPWAKCAPIGRARHPKH